MARGWASRRRVLPRRVFAPVAILILLSAVLVGLFVHLGGYALLAVPAALVVLLVLGHFVVRRSTRPVADLAAAAGSLAAGEAGKRLPAGSGDELAEIAAAINTLAERFEGRVKTIAADRNKLAAILGGMVEGIVAVGGDENVIHMNAVAGALLGVTPSQCVGKPATEVIKVDAISSILRNTMAAASEVKGEVVIWRQPRRGVTIETLASPLRDGDGHLIGAVVVLRDVTELRHLEAVRRDFVANVSHELKTPITAIRGISETMIEDEQMTPETRGRFLSRLQNQAMRLSDLVTDLLTLARLESGDGVLSAATIDLRDPVQYSHNALLAPAEEHGLSVTLELAPRPVRVLGDEQSLRQMITNLLDNAVKYTAAGGRIWLRLRSEGDRAVIEVEDTGVGMEQQHIDRVFERFYRVDKARSRELGGTGLGLSIVKHVCLAHGGEVSVESTPGKGSTFRVTLPLAAE